MKYLISFLVISIVVISGGFLWIKQIDFAGDKIQERYQELVIIDQEKRTRDDSKKISRANDKLLPQGGIPAQLFDINFEIDEILIKDVSELVARLIFVSFGTEDTPVDVTFTIIDEHGKERHTEEDSLIVETEAVLSKQFKDLKLGPGKYSLIVKTLYNVDVEDEFRQDFEISKKFYQHFSFWFFTGLAIMLSTVITVETIGRFNRKKRERMIEMVAK